jgi:formamidopyrimidine-DNA glycosylase
MPELPEVETTKLGLTPLIVNQVVQRAHLYRDNLRWDIPKHLVTTLASQTVNSINRRGKYLLIEFKVGTLIIHLGMSGSIKVVSSDTPLQNTIILN